MRRLNTVSVLAVRLFVAAVIVAQAAPQLLGAGMTELSEAEVLMQTDTPALPSSFYGGIMLDGADVPEDTIVSAWIDGVQVAEARTTTAEVFLPRAVYVLDVPGDDPQTPGVDGGHIGAVVLFRVGGYAAGQIALWHPGTVKELNLAATTEDGLDLAVVADDGRDTALTDEVFTYTVAVANVGTRDATGVALTDTLPPHTSLVSASDGGSDTGGVVAWPAFDLAPGAVAVRTVAVQMDDSLPVDVVEISNTAAVTDDGAHGPDINLSNDTSVDTDTVPEIACAFDPADLAPMGDVGLQAVLDNLLVQWGDWGDLADLGGRDHLVAAIDQVIDQLDAYPDLAVIAQLEDVADQMSSHTGPADLIYDRRVLGRTMCQQLKPVLILLRAYNPSLTAWPSVLATVPGRTVTATLAVVNRGDSPAAAHFALDGVPSGWAVDAPAPLSLEPGVTQQVPLPITPDAFGTEAFSVILRLAEAPELAVTREVVVRVVPELLVVTEVALVPNSLNVGTGTAEVGIRLSNPSGLRASAVVDVALTDASGEVRKSLSTPIVVAVNPVSSLALGALDIEGLEQGVYTATVRILDPDGMLIPNGVGSAHLAIGQDLAVSYDVSPVLVAPGATGITVTTRITTERTDVPTDTASFELIPVQKWHYTPGPGEYENYKHVMAIPIVGDITMDGIPDVIFPSFRNDIYHSSGILRAVSGDDGSLIFANPDYRVNPDASAAVADLDQDGIPEIIIARSGGGMYAFSNTGDLKYSSVPTYTVNNDEQMVAVADLDEDGWPEVIVGRYVLSHDLSQLTILGEGGGDGSPLSSVVGDVNLDGRLEVVAGNTVYAGSGGILSMNASIPANALNALGNFDADPYPEIVLVDRHGGGTICLVDHQMEIIWGPLPIPRRVSDAKNGGPPTVADFDGDGWPEIGVAGSSYYTVFDTDGTVLWKSVTRDVSSGMTGSSVFDFQGDGRAEVVYGDERYLRVYDGADGTVLFEVENSSGTLNELPVIADVDADGYAEIVVVANNYSHGVNNGVRVFESAGEADGNGWVSTRQLWHQHAYDVVGIDDGLRVVTRPTPNWLLYNNFRCQAPTPSQGNTYFIDIHHDLPLTGAAVLPDTITPVPLAYTGEQINWLHTQQDRQQFRVSRVSQLLDPPLQPGEVRRISEGTTVAYTIRDNATVVSVPPLYVRAPHVATLAPDKVVVAAGGMADLVLTLHNPFETEQSFELSVLGVPVDWVTLAPFVTLPAGSSEELLLTVAVPAGVEAQEIALLVRVLLPGGGEDVTSAVLSVREGPRLTLAPPLQAVAYGETASYILTLTNTNAHAETYSFAVEGLESLPVVLADPVALDAGETTTREMMVTAQAQEGALPFAVWAVGSTGLSARAEGGLKILNGPAVQVALSPQSAATSRGVPAYYELDVTNAGSVEDTYDLLVTVPGGWSYVLTADGVTFSEVTLPPDVLNTASLQLIVAPAADALPGDYPVTAVATSRIGATIQDSATAALSILPYGVNVEVTPESATVDPAGTHTWDVVIANTGSQADTFDLAAAGAISSEDGAVFSPSEVALEAGDSAVVQLTAGPLPSALPERDTFIVVARSQGDPEAVDHDTAEVTFEGVAGAEMGLLPEAQTVEDTLEATFVVVITNTGNVDDVYVFSGSSSPALELAFEPVAVYVPQGAAANVELAVIAPCGGDYLITAQAASASTSAIYVDSSMLTVVSANQPPEVEAGPDQAVDEGEVVSFSGSFADPDVADAHTIEWDFDDGATASGTLTPTHSYGDDGAYRVTLTVTDDEGEKDSDTLLVTVENVAPVVSAWAAPALGSPRQEITFGGVFTDPGWLDTHTIEWDFGDGMGATGVLVVHHAYDLGGVYAATLTVTDDDGGVGQAIVNVGVCCELYPIALHISTLEGVAEGEEVEDVYNGTKPGNFGWLSWTGDPSVPALVQSLTSHGDSDTYVNPHNPQDLVLSVRDWVPGRPGVSNAQAVRDALGNLRGHIIIVPIWDKAMSQGNNLMYHVAGFARIQITGYYLPGQNRISAVFLGYVECRE
ncbi:MAG: VCBS repeat-containing protein [Anaerolineae bacterium]|nr:VCBS repeat-containing protein [Anaerolineae bacterium]